MNNTQSANTIRDVVIIGEGAAGLSAALTLARARRSVTVIDAGEPRNAPAAGAHGLLGNEAINPFELLVLPDIEGLRERWGRDVVHCSYCHGWEIRDQALGIITTSEMSAYQAIMFQQWGRDITLFSQGIELGDKELDTLAAVGIPVSHEPVQALVVTDDQLSGVRLADGRTIAVQAVGVSSGMRANLDGLEDLGLETETIPPGTYLKADDTGHTNVPGVWGAGNIIDLTLQISECASQGARVAITMNNELIFAEAKAALAASR